MFKSEGCRRHLHRPKELTAASLTLAGTARLSGRMRAFITGVAGPALTAEERQFLKEAEPWGLIVFKRNIETPEALWRLIADFRSVVGGMRRF